MSDLSHLMKRATDRLEAPGAVTTALEESRRRRTRRRVASALAVVALVGAGATGVWSLGLGRPDAQISVDSPTSPPSPVPSPDPSTDADPATQPVWDPFDTPAMPQGSSLLPPRLDTPAEASSVTEDPLGLALLAVPREGADLLLLGVDGTWRSVPGTADAVGQTLRPVVDPTISHDGTRVAMATDDGLLVVDVSDGTLRTLPWVAELASPRDTPPEVRWTAGDTGLLVLDGRRVWLVGLGGSTAELPWDGRFTTLAVDPTGPVYQSDYERRRLLVLGEEGTPRDAPFLQCERMVALDGLVACTTGSLQPMRSGPVVVEAATGELVAYAPIRDRNAVYSDNGHLTAMGFLDTDTVLLLVGPADFRDPDWDDGEWHLVAWDFREGDFTRLSSGAAEIRRAVVAGGVLGRAVS